MRARGIGRTLTLLLFILLLGAGALYVDWPTNPGIHFGGYNNNLELVEGLDLRGGIQFVMQATCPPEQPKCDIASQMGNVIDNINRRINGGLGLSDATVRQQGSDRLIIQLPGLTDDAEARQLLGKTGQMYIIDTGSTPLSVGTNVSSQLCTDNCQTGQYKIVFKGSDLDGSAVYATISQQTNAPVVEFAFAGAKKGDFAAYTRNNVGKFLTIVLDGVVIESATINSEIDGQGEISGGNMTLADAQQLAAYLKYGALPLPLGVISEQQLAPTLGQEAIQYSIRAALIGLGMVVIFMLVLYRLPGLLADVALLLYSLFLFAVIKLLGAPLSLPGIAALILTIGMAVDANILIFERMKEELRAGRTLAAAVDLGFKRAWPSIRDSNMSTMITCAILYWFGSNFGASIIVSFAINLFIGVAISLFTAIVVTRTLLNLLVPTGVATHPALFGLPTEALNVPRYRRPVSRVPSRQVAAVLAGGSSATARDTAETNVDVDGEETDTFAGTGSSRNGSTPTSGRTDAQGTTRGVEE
jgi:preprotein translocase subunit SecD